MNQIFDLKSLTKEEVAWLEEHFIDFDLVRYERSSTLEGTIEIEWGNKRVD